MSSTPFTAKLFALTPLLLSAALAAQTNVDRSLSRFTGDSDLGARAYLYAHAKAESGGGFDARLQRCIGSLRDLIRVRGSHTAASWAFNATHSIRVEHNRQEVQHIANMDGTRIQGGWSPWINNAGTGSRTHTVGGFRVRVVTGFSAQATWNSVNHHGPGEVDASYSLRLTAQEATVTASNLTGGWASVNTQFEMNQKMNGTIKTTSNGASGSITMSTSDTRCYQRIKAGNWNPANARSRTVSYDFDYVGAQTRFLN